MKDPDGVPTARALGDQPRHELDGLDGRVVFDLGVGRAEFARGYGAGQKS